MESVNINTNTNVNTNKVLVHVESDHVVVLEPLYRTADGKHIVHENDVRGRWLYAGVGTVIPYAEAVLHGLCKPHEDKSRKPTGKK